MLRLRCARRLGIIAVAGLGCGPPRTVDVAAPAGSTEPAGDTASARVEAPRLDTAPCSASTPRDRSTFFFEHVRLGGYPPPLRTLSVTGRCAVLTVADGSEVGVFDAELPPPTLDELARLFPAHPRSEEASRPDMPMTSFSLETPSKRGAFSVPPHGLGSLRDLMSETGRISAAALDHPVRTLRAAVLAPPSAAAATRVEVRLELTNRGRERIGFAVAPGELTVTITEKLPPPPPRGPTPMPPMSWRTPAPAPLRIDLAPGERIFLPVSVTFPARGSFYVSAELDVRIPEPVRLRSAGSVVDAS